LNDEINRLNSNLYKTKNYWSAWVRQKRGEKKYSIAQKKKGGLSSN